MDTTKKTKMDPFYWSILKNWILVNQKDIVMDVFDIRMECIWLNKNITIAKSPIKWNNWIQKDIITIHDIIDENGKFLSIEEMNRTFNFNCNVLQYNQLKDAIPKEWRSKLKTMKVPKNTIQRDENLYIRINKQILPTNLITNKEVYWEIVKNKQLPHVTKVKWEQELNIHPNSWSYIFQNALLIRDTKIRSFQYKLTLNLTPCNLYLYRINRSNTYTCNFCQNIDNITHYFYNCNETKQFWNSFQTWWNGMEQSEINIDISTPMFGIKSKNDKFNKLNACLQMARWHIYIEKLNIHEPSLYKLLCLLRYKIRIEKIISLRNNVMNKFDKLWGEIEEQIE
jgi:hypothetical protein